MSWSWLGAYYVGDMSENMIKQGRGIQTYSNGDAYEG